jgi:SAM-dependent methyltransferase
MGRYSMHLSPQLADFAGVEAGQHVVDVGCGAGALTGELVRRVGADAVTACDPSEQFVEAMGDRYPGVRVDRAVAEQLPYAGGAFDRALAQLVVHFMNDPVAGLRELGRVTRGGGVVAACVWDHTEGGSGPLSPFLRARHRFDPSQPAQSGRAGEAPGALAALFRAAGLHDVEETTVTVRVEHQTFEEWWEPYTLGVGPNAEYIARLEPERLELLWELCREELGPAPFVIDARAWTVRASPR